MSDQEYDGVEEFELPDIENENSSDDEVKDDSGSEEFALPGLESITGEDDTIIHKEVLPDLSIVTSITELQDKIGEENVEELIKTGSDDSEEDSIKQLLDINPEFLEIAQQINTTNLDDGDKETESESKELSVNSEYNSGVDDFGYETYSIVSDYDEDEDEDLYRGLKLDEILSDAITAGASDVYLKAGDVVAFKIHRKVERQPKYGVIEPHHLVRLQQDPTVISNVLQEDFIQDLELDTSYVLRKTIHKDRRTRLNVGKSSGSPLFTFRIISDVIPSVTDLELEQELIDWTSLANGLFLVNGPTGMGKSTTLASLIRHVQYSRPEVILTIEKPVEFWYGTGGSAYIMQREVGRDTRSFKDGLVSAMRQNPDIILVGEVRNREEIDTLLNAAETGHLAISTMHTNSASETINRIKSQYDGDEQRRVLSSLSDSAKGFVNQILINTPEDKMYGLREILPVDKTVSKLILNGDVQGIRDYQERNGLTMEHRLIKAIKDGRCTPQEALKRTVFMDYMKELLAKNHIEP